MIYRSLMLNLVHHKKDPCNPFLKILDEVGQQRPSQFLKMSDKGKVAFQFSSILTFSIQWIFILSHGIQCSNFSPYTDVSSGVHTHNSDFPKEESTTISLHYNNPFHASKFEKSPNFLPYVTNSIELTNLVTHTY
jgi:hypothetical protein